MFDKYGLGGQEESPGIILHNAIQRYSQEDPNFINGLTETESNYRLFMQQLMQGRVTPLDLQDSDEPVIQPASRFEITEDIPKERVYLHNQ